jgi:hypothetical protein
VFQVLFRRYLVLLSFPNVIFVILAIFQLFLVHLRLHFVLAVPPVLIQLILVLRLAHPALLAHFRRFSPLLKLIFVRLVLLGFFPLRLLHHLLPLVYHALLECFLLMLDRPSVNLVQLVHFPVFLVLLQALRALIALWDITRQFLEQVPVLYVLLVALGRIAQLMVQHSAPLVMLVNIHLHLLQLRIWHVLTVLQVRTQLFLLLPALTLAATVLQEHTQLRQEHHLLHSVYHAQLAGIQLRLVQT